LFDVGVANQLHPDIRQVSEGSDVYGRAFEQLMINEVRACLSYRNDDRRLSYWRTSSGFEVDLVVGNMELALELKSTSRLRNTDLRGLRALRDDHKVRRACLVSGLEHAERTNDGIDLLPWKDFVRQLWEGALL